MWPSDRRDAERTRPLASDPSRPSRLPPNPSESFGIGWEDVRSGLEMSGRLTSPPCWSQSEKTTQVSGLWNNPNMSTGLLPVAIQWSHPAQHTIFHARPDFAVKLLIPLMKSDCCHLNPFETCSKNSHQLLQALDGFDDFDVVLWSFRPRKPVAVVVSDSRAFFRSRAPTFRASSAGSARLGLLCFWKWVVC